MGRTSKWAGKTDLIISMYVEEGLSLGEIAHRLGTARTDINPIRRVLLNHDIKIDAYRAGKNPNEGRSAEEQAEINARISAIKMGKEIKKRTDREEVICERCGNSFTRLVTEEQKYCNWECFSEHPWRAEYLSQIVELLDEGFSVKGVAEELDVPYTTMVMWVRKHELEAKGNVALKESVVAAYAAGESAKAVSDKFGVTERSVATWVAQAGLERNPYGGHDTQYKKERYWDQIVQMHAEGLTSLEMSDVILVSYNSIEGWLREEGLKPNWWAAVKGVSPSQLLKDRREKGIQLYLEGMNGSQIARELGVNTSAVYRWIKRYTTGADYNDHTLTEYECAECNVHFKRPHWYNRKAESRFCSVACMHKYGTHRRKNIVVDGIHFDSPYEVRFYEMCKKNKISVERFNRDDCAEWRPGNFYGPDFYLPEVNFYVEVKGLQREVDGRKWQAFRKDRRLAVVFKEHLNQLDTMTDTEVFELLDGLA